MGAGWVAEEYAQLGREFGNRGRRLDEMIQVMRCVWKGGVVEHRGPHYEFDRLQMSPAPGAPIPIYVGGASGPALRRAARNDGWIGAGDDPDVVPARVERLRELRAEAGRESEPFETIVAVTVPPDRDLFRRLEDAGVTGMISYPMLFTLGPGTTLDQKRASLERYGNDIIART